MATTETPERRHWLGKLVERWPTVLGLATVATLGAGVAGDADNELGDILLMLPLLYLIVAKLRRPASTWPVVIGLLVLATVVSKFDIVRTGYVFSTGRSRVRSLNGALLSTSWSRSCWSSEYDVRADVSRRSSIGRRRVPP
ncbi:hypothetical protein ACFWUP_25875 [Nocardia sp. NPDC058658]|uniref:hypothetical protein n=1 Tax=Nocardia sp. NPDC058658 TaxID=3346580 RepID=UPI0036642815